LEYVLVDILKTFSKIFRIGLNYLIKHLQLESDLKTDDKNDKQWFVMQTSQTLKTQQC